MEENILYIIGAIAWFLFSAWQSAQKRKAKQAEREHQQQQEDSREETTAPARPQRENTPSFEDILGELMGEHQPEKPQPVKPVPPPPPKRKPARPLKVVSAPEKRIEGGVPVDEFERFKEFEDPEATKGESLGQELFADQDATAKAFLASEIFRRKY